MEDCVGGGGGHILQKILLWSFLFFLSRGPPHTHTHTHAHTRTHTLCWAFPSPPPPLPPCLWDTTAPWWGSSSHVPLLYIRFIGRLTMQIVPNKQKNIYQIHRTLCCTEMVDYKVWKLYIFVWVQDWFSDFPVKQTKPKNDGRFTVHHI